MTDSLNWPLPRGKATDGERSISWIHQIVPPQDQGLWPALVERGSRGRPVLLEGPEITILKPIGYFAGEMHSFQRNFRSLPRNQNFFSAAPPAGWQWLLLHGTWWSNSRIEPAATAWMARTLPLNHRCTLVINWNRASKICAFIPIRVATTNGVRHGDLGDCFTPKAFPVATLSIAWAWDRPWTAVAFAAQWLGSVALGGNWTRVSLFEWGRWYHWAPKRTVHIELIWPCFI